MNQARPKSGKSHQKFGPQDNLPAVDINIGLDQDHTCDSMIGKKPDDQDDDSSDDSEDDNKFPKHDGQNWGSENTPNKGFDDHRQNAKTQHYDTYNTLGTNGLKIAFVGKQQLPGGYEEDLGNLFQVFETLASMPQVTEVKMERELSIMLGGDALSLYSTRSGEFATYKKSKEMLQSWYNS